MNRMADSMAVKQALELAAKTSGLPRSFVASLARHESSYDPRQKTGKHWGLFQVSPEVLKETLGDRPVGDLLIPVINAQAWALYAKKLLKRLSTKEFTDQYAILFALVIAWNNGPKYSFGGDIAEIVKQALEQGVPKARVLWAARVVYVGARNEHAVSVSGDDFESKNKLTNRDGERLAVNKDRSLYKRWYNELVRAYRELKDEDGIGEGAKASFYAKVRDVLRVLNGAIASGIALTVAQAETVRSLRAALVFAVAANKDEGLSYLQKLALTVDENVEKVSSAVKDVGKRSLYGLLIGLGIAGVGGYLYYKSSEGEKP